MAAELMGAAGRVRDRPAPPAEGSGGCRSPSRSSAPALVPCSYPAIPVRAESRCSSCAPLCTLFRSCCQIDGKSWIFYLCLLLFLSSFFCDSICICFICINVKDIFHESYKHLELDRTRILILLQEKDELYGFFFFLGKR